MKIFLYVLQNYPQEAVAHVQACLVKNDVPVNLFEVSIEDVFI